MMSSKKTDFSDLCIFEDSRLPGVVITYQGGTTFNVWVSSIDILTSEEHYIIDPELCDFDGMCLEGPLAGWHNVNAFSVAIGWPDFDYGYLVGKDSHTVAEASHHAGIRFQDYLNANREVFGKTHELREPSLIGHEVEEGDECSKCHHHNAMLSEGLSGWRKGKEQKGQPWMPDGAPRSAGVCYRCRDCGHVVSA